MKTEEEIEKAALASIENRYQNAFENMMAFSSEIESASGYNNGFIEGAKWMQEKRTEWISINDRLPIGDTWCLCAIKGGVLLYACSYSVFSEKWMPYGMAQYEDRVTHWMYLPKSPTS